MPQPRDRPLLTYASAEDSLTLTGKSTSVSCGVAALFSLVLVHTSFCVPSKSLFPQSHGNSLIKSQGPSKSNSLGVLSPFARSSGWKISVGPRTFATVGEFFRILVLQFVDHLLGGSVVELMATFSKRTHATNLTSQVFCSQSFCPCGGSLLTCASAGVTQTLKIGLAQPLVGRSLILSLGPGHA